MTRDSIIRTIHGVDPFDYVTNWDKDGYVEMDINGLTEAINNSATCTTLNCTNGTAGDGICSSCFMASILGKKVWLNSRKGYVRMDKEFRYYE